ncbi:MAG: hypothetical protein ACKVQB_13435 [Bacteroidia bacterium]
MFKKNWPFIIAGVIVLSLASFFYYVYVKSPTYNWIPNYNHSSNSPYGNELLYKVMKGLYPQRQFTTIEEPLFYNRAFNSVDKKNNIYFYSGHDFLPDRSTISALYNFINKGNQVFITANEVSQYFLDSLLHPELSLVHPQDKQLNALSLLECVNIKPNMLHPLIKLNKVPVIKFKVYEAVLPMSVGYFSTNFFDTQELNTSDYNYYRIGYFNISKKEEYTNYIKIKVGEGWLHLYSSPLVFTNYHLRQQEVFNYAQKVFTHLEPGDVFWHVNSYASQGTSDGAIEKGKSPFGVLLSFPSFRYAWYSFIGALFLFCIFNFKRRQRAIPVLETNSNTSIDFAATITKLYLADGKHKNIAQQKFRYFFNYVRTKFGINLKENSSDEKSRLSYLSKVNLNNIDKIMFHYIQMESLPDTTAEELNESVILINDFYKISG